MRQYKALTVHKLAHDRRVQSRRLIRRAEWYFRLQVELKIAFPLLKLLKLVRQLLMCLWMLRLEVKFAALARMIVGHRRYRWMVRMEVFACARINNDR